MKLVFGDDKKMYSYILPNSTEDFYMINFTFYTGDLSFNEVLTLKYREEKWHIIADDKLKIKVNNADTSEVILKEFLNFELKFADMSNYFQVYILPDFYEYLRYSIYDADKIDIGSDSNCEIFVENFYNISLSIKNIGMGHLIKRIDSNKFSSYVNGLSYDEKKLNPGDIIFVNGIKIIYMKSFIMINLFNYNAKISNLPKVIESNNGIENPITPVTDIEKNVKLYNDDEVFSHSPRLKTELELEIVEFEEPPVKNDEKPMPAIFTTGASLVMVLMSGTSFINNIKTFITAEGERDYFSFLVDAIVFGLMVISSFFIPLLMNKWEQHMKKKNEKKRQKKYKAYIEEKNELVNQIIKKQENILKNNNISLENICENIANKNTDVWSREIFDTDFLQVMVGYGNLPAKIEIEAPKKTFSLEDDNLKDLVIEAANKKPMLSNVPITFSILEKKVLPIVNNSNNAYDYIRSLMLQIIYNHSGRDLKIVTITNEYNESRWEFLKTLSHNWDKKYEKRYFATNEDEMQQVAMFLEQEFESRINNRNENSKTEDKYLNYNEYYLIVTDDYKMVRELPIISKILDSEINYGFSILIFEDSIKNLPSRFSSLVEITDESGKIILRDTANNDQILFKPTYIKNLDLEKYARVIANIPVTIKNENTSIPTSLSFLDMFHAGRVDQLNILSRWQKNNPTISLKTIIGFKGNDKPVELDLHEKFHGPHGLIAGSTGSGKSEFIITFILSLAVNYHPYEVQFVLIDYKGGGLAGAFENRETGIRIPHLVGTITNLDKSEMGRTLVSIKSELQRRQRVFNETREALDESTIDIYKYQRLYREGKVKEPMSHLFIISDEFAELKAQQPEFMDELVSAARIGRSLGVHLILATQKPTGVVDDQIWSNTRFRICLKVQTIEDSNELLKRNDAAYIKEAGRFYMQIGNDEIFELGQSGWSGAKYVPSDNVQRKVNDNIIFINNNGEILKTVNEEVKKEATDDLGDQLTNIVKYLYNLAKKENLKFSKLWLDNVPEVIYYDNLVKKYNKKSKPYIIEPLIGEYDDPSNQNQGCVMLPITDVGNIYICGITGSGKTTLLSEIIYSTIINHNSDEVNIYIVDLGTEKLKKFAKAPQVGDVLTSAEPEKIKFLFYMLKDERDRRFTYYSQNGGSFDSDVKNGKSPFPNILVIINDFDVFKEAFDDLYENDFSSLSRNCAKVGIYLIITSTLANSLGYMIEGNFPKRVMLNMGDATEYANYFNNAPIPKKNPGRGVIEIMEQGYEFQVPLIFEETTYDAKISYILNQLSKYLTKHAKKVPVVPEEVTIDMLRGKIKKLNDVPIGVNIKTAQISTFDFAETLSVCTSENHSAAKKFFPKLFEILSEIAETKIIVINSLKELKIEETSNIKYYDNSYDKVINVINKKISKYFENESTENIIVVFLGYNLLQRKLEKLKEDDDEIVTIEDLIYNAKSINNFKFILYDKEEALSRLGDGKIDSLFKRSRGLWIGKGFDGQQTFDVINQYTDAVITNSNVVMVEHGQANYIKYN